MMILKQNIRLPGLLALCVCLFSLQAEENLGMVMIFTLVTAVQEKLNEIVDMMKTRRDEEKQRKEREAEEAEKVGTGKA